MDTARSIDPVVLCAVVVIAVVSVAVSVAGIAAVSLTRQARILECRMRRLSAGASHKRRRKRNDNDAVHPGHGLWDDYKALFDPALEQQLDPHRREVLLVEFQRDFRLTVHSFLFVLSAIGRLLGRQPGSRGPSPVHTPGFILATVLYYLATGATYKEVCIAMRNGLSKASVMRFVVMVTSAIVHNLGHLIRFPDSFSILRRLADSFYMRSGIPGIIGAIDGSHIRVHPKKRNQVYYINRKGFCSVILSAVVDPRGYFMNIAVGYPGRMGDSRVLQLSPLWTSYWNFFARFGFCIYGDAAYPLREWLLVGYRDRLNATAKQIKFNRCGSRARVIVESAFGKLKGQWRCLMDGLRTDTPADWKLTIAACCILHNITIKLDKKGWKFSDDFNAVRKAEDSWAFANDPDNVRNEMRPCARDTAKAKRWRDALADEVDARF